MKAKLFIIFSFFVSFLQSQSQSEKEISYIVGSINFPEYKPTTKVVDASSYTFTPSNVTAPILYYYFYEKKRFIGNILVDEKGNKTVVVDINLTDEKKVVNFEIVGKKFSRSFNTKNGVILKEEKNNLVFYTEGIGIWMIYKNNSE